jgi:hypothetical protein
MCDSGVGDFTILRQNSDDRYNFLKMAFKHEQFFKWNKDIRLYLAKWFFYDVVDVVERLMELVCKRYSVDCSDFNLRQQCIARVKSIIPIIRKVAVPFFAEILYKPWFWGCRSSAHDAYVKEKNMRDRVYLGKEGLFYVFPDFDQRQFYQIETESLKRLIKFMDEVR